MVVVSSTFSAPSEGVLVQMSSKLFVNEQELGTGSLYITERDVVWCGDADAPTLILQYPTISLHGVQKDPTPALFMVINFELRLPQLGNMESGDAQGAENDDDFDPEEQYSVTQLRFVPPNEEDVQVMYAAMCEGQSLHPDPQDEIEEDDPYMDGEDLDEDDMFEDAEEIIPQPDEAAARLRQLRLENTNGHTEDNGVDNVEE